MSITSNGHTGSWVAEQHEGELLFVIMQNGVVSMAKQDWVTEQAYSDALNAPKDFASDWTLVYVREPDRDRLDLAKVSLEHTGEAVGGASNVMTPTRLVVNNLVTGETHHFDLD